ncbi:hypothetical protein MesoLjLc_67890 [Mesorhizobium sp. L-8-10]|uniref:hypothetical protein n=1 Tax=Mesorhizobium sp. L-8-10 TaxID=2744523 RepID=UPI001927EF8B|nr:hypothetical protein [Mesorhizobium sp. L-8-10]BCH34859.1 hypothetical protein MesoLjLc_67890 [Mesorhizobium sp. L-8-10]
MSARDRHTLQTEPTPQGEQTLIPGVQPPRATASPFWPMRPRAAQKPLDIGLFDDARNQLDLF